MNTGASAEGAVDLDRGVELFRSYLREKTTFLKNLRSRLSLYEAKPAHRVHTSAPEDEEAGTIFIVHGHDRATELEALRFLERATDLRPIVLHDEANRGRTIIEKFEQVAATARFAVVLLTPDDEGRALNAPALQPRPRQNVVFELGFFFGALGRNRVAALYTTGTERPSDIEGVAYIELDRRGAWKTDLFRELRAAEIPVHPEALAG
jgi:predicted nucleotide-binding protein